MTTTIPRASAILGAARTLAAKLLLAVPIDRAALSQAMTESAYGSDAEGAWQQRDSFEALEVALSLAIPDLVGRMDVGAAIATLEALVRELPTHTVRSENQIQFQQFSTPPALAVLQFIWHGFRAMTCSSNRAQAPGSSLRLPRARSGT
jgi:hypothetical protein